MDGPWYVASISGTLLFGVTFNTFIGSQTPEENVEAAYQAFRVYAQSFGILVDDGTKILLPAGGQPARIIVALYDNQDEGAGAILAKLNSMTGLSVDDVTSAGATHPTSDAVQSEMRKHTPCDLLCQVQEYLWVAILLAGLALSAYLYVNLSKRNP